MKGLYSCPLLEGCPMWSHESVWGAIDALATRYGLSPSGLAKRAGLDPTAFNRSKRFGGDGRPRWPSTESIAKVLAATGESLEGFVGLGRRGQAPAPEPPAISSGTPFRGGLRPVPLLGLAQAGPGGFFDDGGFPTGQGWDEVAFPALGDETAYALEVSGDSMQPLYRDGDIIIVSPAAKVRRGDRIVVRTAEGEVMAKVLKRQTPTDLELGSLNQSHPDRTLARRDVAWVARILWASQ
jgi:phage repressor protein C with HTH and peptisase S24 domain